MLRTASAIRTILPRNVAALSVVSARSKHKLPDLPYDFNALEPYISAEIMKIHYEKHHAAYVNNLNIAEEKLAEAQAKITPGHPRSDLLHNVAEARKRHGHSHTAFEIARSMEEAQEASDVFEFPEPSADGLAGCIKTIISLIPALRFNGGGHINHSIFWQNLAPKTAEEPTGELKDAINRDFGSFENLRIQLSAASVGVQGSGWGWLGYNKLSHKLEVATCPNQDPLEPTTGLIPLFGIDVWEHAYYLQYKNVRPDYVKAIWNVANWKDIATRLANAKKG